VACLICLKVGPCHHSGDKKVAKLLFEYKLDCSKGNPPPALVAMKASKPSPDVIQLLVQHGADVNPVDEVGRTPFALALSLTQNVRLFIV